MRDFEAIEDKDRLITLSNNGRGFYTVTIQTFRKDDDIRPIAATLWTRFRQLDEEKFGRFIHVPSLEIDHNPKLAIVTMPHGVSFTDDQLKMILSIKTDHGFILEVGAHNPELSRQVKRAIRDVRTQDWFDAGSSSSTSGSETMPTDTPTPTTARRP